MDMIRHQAVSINFATQFGFPFTEITSVMEIVFITCKYYLSIVAALDDMMRTIREH
jgi:hypothetical protein